MTSISNRIVSLFVLAVFVFCAAFTASAQVINFEPPTYSVGNINGQDGWMKTGPYDAAVAPSSVVGFGTQSLRMSNAITSGSFGDQTFAPAIPNGSGETSSTNGVFPIGVKQNRFSVQFSIASVIPGSQQAGLNMTVSPDRGDGSRMSFLRFEDQADGIHVIFFDYQDVAPFGVSTPDPNGCGTGDNFVGSNIATLNRTLAHTIKLVIDFVDGPRNDVVRVYVNGVLAHTGTSWEDYYRYCTESSPENSPRTVRTTLFRSSGTAAPAHSGNGFFFDNIQMGHATTVVDDDGMASSTDCDAADPTYSSIQDAVTAASAGDTIKVCQGTYVEQIAVPSGKNNLNIVGANAGIQGNGVRGPESIVQGNGVSSSPFAGVFTIRGDNTTIDGFRVEVITPPVLSNARNGIRIFSDNSVAQNNVVVNTSATATGPSYGVAIQGTSALDPADGNQVLSNLVRDFTNSSGHGMNIGGPPTNPTTNTLIENNEVTNNRNGVYVDRADGTIVRGNLIVNNLRSGIVDFQNAVMTTLVEGNTFDGNNVIDGGGAALNLFGSSTTVIGNRITNNAGIAVWRRPNGVFSGVSTVNYNRIVGNGTGINNTLPDAMDAENNWWGCNYGPGATGAGCSGTTNGVTGAVDADPWLTLTTSAAPSFVTVGGNATVTSPLTINSNNVDTSGGGNIPDGTPASFGATLGTVLPTSSTTSSGVTSTVFTAGMTEGVGSASTTVDGQTTTVNIPIYNATCAQVSMPTDTTLTGVPITVPIETDLMTGRDAISADFTITYDPAVLTLPGGPDFGVTLGPVGAGRVLTVNQPFLGTLIISVFGPEPFTGNGALVNLNFTNVPGLPFDVSPMNFSSFMYNEGTPCSTTTNGSVTVIGGTITGNVTYGNALVGPAPPRYINNVTISGAGAPPVFTTTDTNGNYSLSGFGPGSYTRSASKTGGIPSGSISAYDSSLIAQHVVMLITLSANQQIVADVSGAGGITSFDAALIARYTVLLPDFGNTGNWIFSPTSYGPSTVYTNLTEDYVGLLMGDVSGNWNQLASEPGGLWDPQGARNDEARRAMVKAPVITANPDSTFEVPVTIRGAVGRGVVAYNFELSYDPNVVRPLENPVTVDDTVSGGLTVVSNAEGGVLRVAAFGVAPIDQDGVLIKVRFRAVGTPGSSTHLSWDKVFLNEDMNGATGVDGSTRIKSPHADEVETELSGRVMTATGERIAKAAVTITDLSGNSIVVYTDRSGVFTIPNVEYGQTYNVTVANTRYTFLPITISISDRAIGLDIVAEQ
ncbi:MAG: right-handed parallel beta-helix repeat-containing protein [Acidobacteriota bacterium]|nr:MAG: right-handed parallel beta-helix repeat-containing protein [Acidobacteriota bacterium]